MFSVVMKGGILVLVISVFEISLYSVLVVMFVVIFSGKGMFFYVSIIFVMMV